MLEKCYIPAKLESLSQLKYTNYKLSHYFPVLLHKWKTQILMAVCIIQASVVFVCVCECVCVFVCVCVCVCACVRVRVYTFKDRFPYAYALILGLVHMHMGKGP